MAVAHRDDVTSALAVVLDALPAVDDEVRRALARELHDRVAQTLTALLIDLENFKVEQVGRASVRSRVDMVQGSMREVLSSLRDLVHDLRGDTAGGIQDLRQSLSKLVADFEHRTGIVSTLTVQHGWPSRIKPSAALNLYRIAEEALVNAGRHSGAKRVAVKLGATKANDVLMTVTDYGRGFDREAIAPGIGTLGMHERAVLLGASICVDTYPGHGTSVHVTLPRSVVAAEA